MSSLANFFDDLQQISEDKNKDNSDNSDTEKFFLLMLI